MCGGAGSADGAAQMDSNRGQRKGAENQWGRVGIVPGPMCVTVCGASHVVLVQEDPKCRQRLMV